MMRPTILASEALPLSSHQLANQIQILVILNE